MKLKANMQIWGTLLLILLINTSLLRAVLLNGLNLNLYLTINGTFSMLHGASMNFPSAIQYCAASGGNLASLQSSAETKMLNQFLVDNEYDNGWFGLMSFGNGETVNQVLFTNNSALYWLNGATGFSSSYPLSTNGFVTSTRFMRYYFNNVFCLTLNAANWIVSPPGNTTASCASTLPVICKVIPTNKSCPSSWSANSGNDNVTRCYKYNSTLLTWWAAVGYCYRIAQAQFNQPGYLLFIDASDLTEIDYLQNLTTNTVWLGALDKNPINETSIASSDYWIDGTLNTYREPSSRSVFCSLIANSTWRNSSISQPFSNYSSSDCYAYQAPAAFCRYPIANFVPTTFNPQLEQVNAIQYYNFSVIMPLGCPTTSINIPQTATFVYGYVFLNNGNLCTINTPTITSRLDVYLQNNANSNLFVSCARSVQGTIIGGSITSNISGANQVAMSLVSMSSSKFLIDGSSSCSAYPFNSTTAAVTSSSYTTDIITIQKFNSCTTGFSSSNVTATTTSITVTHSACQSSIVTGYAAGNAATISVNNASNAVQTISGAPTGSTTLTNVGVNEATVDGGSYLAVAINLGGDASISCQSTYGYVITGTQVTSNTIIVPQMTSYVSSRVGNVSTNNIFVSNVPTLNSTVAYSGADSQNVANVTVVNVIVVATTSTSLSFAASANVYTTLWNVASATHALANVGNAVLSATNVNYSYVTCPNYYSCVDQQSNNTLQLIGTSVTYSTLTCANLSSFSYNQNGGNVHSVNVTLLAANATFTLNSVSNDSVNVYSTGVTSITKTVTSANYSSLVLSNDPLITTTVTASGVGTHSFSQSPGSGTTLTLINVTTSTSTVCANVVNGYFHYVQQNTVQPCTLGTITLSEYIGGSMMIVAAQDYGNASFTLNVNSKNVNNVFFSLSRSNNSASVNLITNNAQSHTVNVNVPAQNSSFTMNDTGVTTLFANVTKVSPYFTLNNVGTSSILACAFTVSGKFRNVSQNTLQLCSFGNVVLSEDVGGSLLGVTTNDVNATFFNLNLSSLNVVNNYAVLTSSNVSKVVLYVNNSNYHYVNVNTPFAGSFFTMTDYSVGVINATVNSPASVLNFRNVNNSWTSITAGQSVNGNFNKVDQNTIVLNSQGIVTITESSGGTLLALTSNDVFSPFFNLSLSSVNVVNNYASLYSSNSSAISISVTNSFYHYVTVTAPFSNSTFTMTDNIIGSINATVNTPTAVLTLTTVNESLINFNGVNTVTGDFKGVKSNVVTLLSQGSATLVEKVGGNLMKVIVKSADSSFCSLNVRSFNVVNNIAELQFGNTPTSVTLFANNSQLHSVISNAMTTTGSFTMNDFAVTTVDANVTGFSSAITLATVNSSTLNLCASNSTTGNFFGVRQNVIQVCNQGNIQITENNGGDMMNVNLFRSTASSNFTVSTSNVATRYSTFASSNLTYGVLTTTGSNLHIIEADLPLGSTLTVSETSVTHLTATIKNFAPIISLANVTNSSVQLTNVASFSLTLQKGMQSTVTLSNVQSGTISYTDVNSTTINCLFSSGAINALTVNVYKPSCPLVTCPYLGILYLNVWNYACTLPQVQSQIVFVYNVPNLSVQNNNFNMLSLTAINTTQSSVFLSNAQNVSLNFNPGGSVSSFGNVTINLTAISSTAIIANNLRSVTASLSKISGGIYSFTNVSTVSLTFESTQGIVVNLSSVSVLTISLIKANRVVTFQNISTVSFNLDDFLYPRSSNFHTLPPLQKSWPVSAINGRYNYYLLSSGNLTWTRALEQCRVIGANLTSIMNDQEIAYLYDLLANFSTVGTQFWLGTMTSPPTLNTNTVYKNQVNWVYRNDNALVSNVIINIWPPVRTLCLAYNSITQMIQEAPTLNGKLSCFNELRFVCKMPLTGSNCSSNWVMPTGSNYCYLYVPQYFTWPDALGHCAYLSNSYPADVVSQSRLLDFDSWDLAEAAFINQITSNATIWISGLNLNALSETATINSWVDQSPFIQYNSINYNGPSYNHSSKSTLAIVSSDYITARSPLAVCKSISPPTAPFILMNSTSPMTLQQAILKCGTLSGNIASMTNFDDINNVTSLLSGQTSSWLGVMTFPSCMNDMSAKIVFPDSHPSMDTSQTTTGKALCQAFDLTTKSFSNPTGSNTTKSCFQNLPFICKQNINGQPDCPNTWNTTSSNKFCYNYVSTPMTWPAAVAYCGSLAMGQQASFDITAPNSVPRLLYFLSGDLNTEVEQLKTWFPTSSKIWTMGLNNGSVCENDNTGLTAKDYWVDGTPFKYLGLNATSWLSRSTFCPRIQLSAPNLDWITTSSSQDCVQSLSSAVVCTMPVQVTTTTSTTPSPSTTTYPLPTPYYLSDVRYGFTADHYWCFAGQCLSDVNSTCNYTVAYWVQVNLTTNGSIFGQMPCFVPDSGKPMTNQIIALANYRRLPAYVQLPISVNGVMNVTIVSDSIASSVLSFSSSTQSCILVANYSQVDFANNQRCFFRPELCYYGFSAAVWVKFNATFLYAANPSKLTIFGTEQSGFMLYQVGLLTGVRVAAGFNQWIYEVVDSQITANVWLNIGFRWSASTGIYIYVNNIEYMSSVSSQFSTVTLPYPISKYLTIGCTMLTTGVNTNYADIQLAHVALWLWNLREPERVYISGGLNYKLVPASTQAAVVQQTTASYNSFIYDYFSNMVSYQPTWTTNYNPMFNAANFYRQLADSVSVTASTASKVVLTPATNVPQISVAAFVSASSNILFSLTSVPGSCMNPTNPNNKGFCTNGLSVGIMLNISSSAYQISLAPCSPVCSYILIWSYGNFAMYMQNGLLVVEFSNGDITSVQYPLTKMNQFVSVGFSWYPGGTYGRALRVYFNGVAQRSSYSVPTPISVATYQTTVTPQIYTSGALLVGNSLGTLAPMQLRDLVIWERYLFGFEAGRFMGLTPDQFAMFLNNDYWWTTDVYAYNTMQLLAAADSIYLQSGVNYAFVPDRWDKSVGINMAPTTSGVTAPWFIVVPGYPVPNTKLGLFPSSSCVTNPSSARCMVLGLSAAIWIIVREQQANNIQVFFSSGDASGQMYADDPNGLGLDGWSGFSFLQNGQYIGVSVSTTTDNWEMYMDQTLFTVGTWINLGFTWSYTNGLRLFINGQYTGLTQQQGVTFKRYSTAALSHGRATVGRYSSDLTYFFSSAGSYSYANIAVSDLFVEEREVMPEQFASLVGLSSNQFYYTATTYYTSSLLVTGTPIMLTQMQTSLPGFTYGPFGNVAYSVGVDLTGTGSGLLLEPLGASNCLQNVSLCASTGLSLSMWVKFSNSFAPLMTANTTNSSTSNSTAKPAIVYLLRSFFYPTHDGVQISAQSGKLTFVVKYAGTMYSASLHLFSLPVDRYVNLAFTWQPFGKSYQLTLYVNGSFATANTTISSYYSGVALAVVPLVIGSFSTDSPSTPTDFSVYNLAYWNQSFTSAQASMLAGLSSIKALYLSEASLYWVFCGEYQYLQQFKPQLYGGAQLVSDRFATGWAVQLASASQSYVLLATAQQLLSAKSCLVVPSQCVGFFMQFWAILSTETGSLISCGAEDANITGVAVNQSSIFTSSSTSSGNATNNQSGTTSAPTQTLTLSTFLGVLIRASTYVTWAQFNVTTTVGMWASYAVFWNLTSLKLSLYVNNNPISATSSGFYAAAATNRTADLVLGRASTLGRGYVSAVIDDLFITNVMPYGDFSLNSMIQQVSCYAGAYAVYPMNSVTQMRVSGNSSLVNSHLGTPLRAISLHGLSTLVLGTLVGCSSSPASCSVGLTISVWARVDSLPTATRIDQTLAVLVASGSPSNSTSFAIYLVASSLVSPPATVRVRFELNDGSNYWLVDQSVSTSAVLSTWTNYALSWASGVGLFAYLNGSAIVQQLQRVSSPNGATNNSFAALLAGRFYPADPQLYGSVTFDTVAFWQTPFTTPGGIIPRTLTGDCSMPLAFVATAVPTAAFVITLPQGVQCSLQVSGICTDASVTNVLALGNKSFPYAIPYEAATQLAPSLSTLTRNVILKGLSLTGSGSGSGSGSSSTANPNAQSTSSATSSLASLLSSCAQVLRNMAINSVPSAKAPPTSEQAVTTVSSVVNAVSNLVTPSTSSAWSSAGTNWTASLLWSLETFTLNSASKMPSNTSTCFSQAFPNTQLVTHVTVVDPNACPGLNLTFPVTSDANVASTMSGWGAPRDTISLNTAALTGQNTSVAVVSTIYDSIANMLPNGVSAGALAAMNKTSMVPNSRIISVATLPYISNWTSSTPLVKASLQLRTPNRGMKYSFVCAFWNFSANATGTGSSSSSTNGAWDTAGCKAVSANSTSVTCACNHMTNFAVLMQPVPAAVPDLWAQAFFYIYMIGLSVSIACLLWFLVALLKCKSNLFKDDRCLIHLNLIGAFLISDVLLVVAATLNGGACQLVAIFVQLFVTAAFVWLYFEQLHLHYAITAGVMRGRFWKCYVPLGWLLPAVLTGVCAALSPLAYGTDWRCWLQFGSIPLYVFEGSCALFNVLALVTGAVVLCNVRSSKCRLDLTLEFQHSARMYVACCVVLVVGWFCGAFAIDPVAIPFELVYMLTFAFNGLYVLVFFGFGNKQIGPLLIGRTWQSKVIDSAAASMAGSLIDLQASDKARLVVESRLSSARSKRPASSVSARSSASATHLDVTSVVARVSYVPDPELIARLKKKQEELAQENASNPGLSVPSNLFQVTNRAAPTRRLLPLNRMKNFDVRTLPSDFDPLSSYAHAEQSIPENTTSVEKEKENDQPAPANADNSAASTSAAAPKGTRAFIKPKKNKPRHSAKDDDAETTSPTPSAFIKPKKKKKSQPVNFETS